MLTSYALGVLVLVLVAVGWVGTQLAWSKTFASEMVDPDPLAGRMGCQSCTCNNGTCEKDSRESQIQEEAR